MQESEDARLDPAYTPYPSFSEWYKGGFNTTDFARYESLFNEAKGRAAPGLVSEALTAIRRYAAVDTGAIEGLYSVDRGFTRTVATRASAWEAVVEARGAHVRSFIEDALRAYDFVSESAAENRIINPYWIRQLHELVCASQETYTVDTDQGLQERPLPKGAYKTLSNSPTLLDGRVHAYASVMETPHEMRRLTDEFQSEAFVVAHPVLQAAYSHYAYVCVHPFADGNGRVARALANYHLYRRPGVPLVIFADQRNMYFDALAAADFGNSAPFIEFVGVRTLDSIGIVKSMLYGDASTLAGSLEKLSAIYSVGSPTSEMRAATSQVRNALLAEVDRQFRGIDLPSQLKLVTGPAQIQAVQPPDGFASLGDSAACYATISGSWPVKIYTLLNMTVLLRIDANAAADMLVASRTDDALEVWFREVSPVQSETLKLKLSGWVRGKVAELMAEVERQASMPS